METLQTHLSLCDNPYDRNVCCTVQTVLHCSWLYCTVLYCTVLYCTVLYLRTVIMGRESCCVPPSPKTMLPRYMRGSGQIFLRVSRPRSGKEITWKNLARNRIVMVATIWTVKMGGWQGGMVLRWEGDKVLWCQDERVSKWGGVSKEITCIKIKWF